MREYKYVDLERFFKEFREDYIELSFKDIERIAGVQLEKSAYTYYAYWQPSPTHTITLSWINAGFKKDNLNIKKQKISFVRDKNLVGITPDRVIKTKETTTIKEDKKCIKKTSVDIDQLLESATCFMQVFNSDNHSRYQSWEHCYKNFVTYKDKELAEEVVDYLSLHLAFYLASWGMLRGSSFLLQKDYKVHKDAVKELYQDKYKELWGISCKEVIKGSNLDLIMKLSDTLETIYVGKRQNLDDYDKVSNILITKILMGTLGCVPAYDRYLVFTLSNCNIASISYNKQSLSDIAGYYNDNRDKLEKFRNKVKESRKMDYPEMKILDMIFWYYGLSADQKVKEAVRE